jgi:hypothetical protein
MHAGLVTRELCETFADVFSWEHKRPPLREVRKAGLGDEDEAKWLSLHAEQGQEG